MRKSIDTKLKVVKKATSPKKIRKMSLQYGVTVKTIKNWIRQAAEGRFSQQKNKKIACNKKNAAAERTRPLRHFVYKAIAHPLHNNECECKELFRHIFRDKDYGYIFCSYSLCYDNETAVRVCSSFVSELAASGYKVKSITTDKVKETEFIERSLSEPGVKVTRMNFAEIKKFTVFSPKKNSYIKERSKYESCGDFLVDSLATVCRNNELLHLTARAGAKKRALEASKMINTNLHSSIINKEKCSLSGKGILPALDSDMKKATGFHQKYDLDNAESIYEKLYYILKNSPADKNLLVKVIIQRAKISGLRKCYSGAEDYILEGFRVLKESGVKAKCELEYNLHMLNADISRYKGNKKGTLKNMEKARSILGKISDKRTSAIFYLNNGKVLNGYGMVNKAIGSYEMARTIVDDNDLSDLKPAVEESFASAYSISGCYDEAKIVFEKMIAGDFYSDSPYFRALLYAKYADLFHLTGELRKSLVFYDRALEIVSKHSEVEVFTQLSLIIGSNKAFSLMMMNSYDSACEIFLKNLTASQNKNYADLVLSNTAYLLMCFNEQGLFKEAEKYLKNLGLLLKNVSSPEKEYKYYLGLGMILMGTKDSVKAEENLLKAVSIADAPDLPTTAYFISAVKLADFYAVTGDSSKLIKITDSIIKRAMKNNFSIVKYKAEIIRKKAEYFLRDNKSSYIEYLNDLKGIETNDEKIYFLEREIIRNSDN